MFSDHNRIQLESNDKDSWKILKYLETNIFLNNPWVKEGIKGEIKLAF